MPIKTVPLHSKDQTIKAMFDLCYRYNTDLTGIYIDGNPLCSISLQKFYDYLRSYPYRKDNLPNEVIARPYRAVQLPSLDCKKKTVLMGCYALYNKIPFRFCVVSQRPDKEFHHIFPELKIGSWQTFDATYPHYYIGMHKKYTAIERFTA